MKKFILSLLCLLMVVGCSKPKEEPIPTTFPHVFGEVSEDYIRISCFDARNIDEKIIYDIYTNEQYEVLGIKCYRAQDADMFNYTFTFDHTANENVWDVFAYCYTRAYENDSTVRLNYATIFEYFIENISDDEIKRLKNDYSIMMEEFVNNAITGVNFYFDVNEKEVIGEYFLEDEFEKLFNEHDH